MSNLSLLTDLYQLTMMAGYHSAQKLDEHSSFDLYFRRLPFGGGYCIAAGLELALDYVSKLRFTDDDLSYLESLNLFEQAFLTYLADFEFEGDIYAMQEGELVFPGEPILRVEAALPQAQLIESALLNIMNFQTLVASKASRVCQAAEDGVVLEFGLRRAQGINGAMASSRAAYLGGCHATSNVLAGQKFGIPVKGTHAHSWIMSFSTELEAFRAYAKAYPDSCTLLVDTYDTLESGVPNAIIVGKELAEKGHSLAGIRLDSGDLGELSRRARKMLNEAGLESAKIVASNDLDEHSIHKLKAQGSAIDIWGVGTNLVTCKDEPALGGVYKLAASKKADSDWVPRIKISSNPVKTTVPGRKQVYRATDNSGQISGDLVCLVEENLPQDTVTSKDLFTGQKDISFQGVTWRPLLEKVWSQGARVSSSKTLKDTREFSLQQLSSLSPKYKTIVDPQHYPVAISEELNQLRQRMLSEH